MKRPQLTDAIGKTSEERFREVRAYFFELLSAHGQSRRELYSRPKPGDSREPTEEEVVRRWAEVEVMMPGPIRIKKRPIVLHSERLDVETHFM